MDLFEDLLFSDLTPEVRALARNRILFGGNLATRIDLDPIAKNVALRLVARLSPETVLTQAEAAIIHGINPKTVGERYGGQVLAHRLNVKS